MEVWLKVARQTVLRFSRLGGAISAILLALLSCDLSQVNAESPASTSAERWRRIAVTSRTGVRRIIFVREEDRVDNDEPRMQACKGNCRDRAEVARQSEKLEASGSELDDSSVPISASGPRRWSCVPTSNVERTGSQPTQIDFSDSVPALLTEDHQRLELDVPSATEYLPSCASKAGDQMPSPRTETYRAEKGPRADIDHSERAKSLGGSGVSPDARLVPAETIDQRPRSEFIVIGLILCNLLLLLVIVLLLRRLSAPLQSTIRVEMGHALTTPRSPAAVVGLANARPLVEGLDAMSDQEREAKAGETAPEEAAILERIVEDNVSLCEKLAGSAA